MITAITWQEMADQLRDEAAEYGRLLGYFESQQHHLFQQEPQEVLAMSHSIRHQSEALERLRRDRESAVAAFAYAHGRPESCTLRSLLDLMPPEAQPLFEALIGEINRLIHRVRRAAKLNHRLLGAVVEVHQEIMRRVRPDSFTKTYSASGRVSLSTVRRLPALRTAS
ncbi:MAG TPA: flagellar export chaperone FlgN [Opitutaceae bacterium]|jgi:flagellar biosynthesis/type III secretory pathway chaperone